MAAAAIAAAMLVVVAMRLEETVTWVRVVPEGVTIEGPKVTGRKPVELLRVMAGGTGAIRLETKVLQ